MPFARVQHIWNPKSGVPEDQIVNTFHFTGPGPLDLTGAAALATVVRGFYEAENLGVGVAPISSFIASKALMTPAHTVKVYNMEDAEPRVPLYQTTTPQSIINTKDPLPHEVALCLSYRATPQSGSIQARERGRIYIGPIADDVDTWQTATGVSRPSTSFMNSLLSAGVRMAAEALSAGFTFSVYSPTTAAQIVGGGGNFGTFPVDEFLVDDAWDTIRSRGPRRLSRVTALVA